MKEESIQGALEILERVAPREMVEVLKEDYGICGSGVYTPFIVIWLLVYQWLMKKVSLSAAVSELLYGSTKQLLPDHKRVRDNKLSEKTGTYSQARSKLPLELVEKVVELICDRMSKSKNHLWHGKRAYILDGTTGYIPQKIIPLESLKNLRGHVRKKRIYARRASTNTYDVI